MVKAALLHWISKCPLGLTICIIGIFGNIISTCVWSRIIKKRLASGVATSIFIIALAVADCLLLIFYILVETIPAASSATTSSPWYIFFYCYFGYPLYYFFIIFSTWMIVAVTACRYLVVKYPLKNKVMCSPFRCFLSIIIIITFVSAVNIPRFFIYHPKPVNGTFYMVKTEFGVSRVAQMYKFWVHCLLLMLAPWVSLSLMNIGIMRAMKKRLKRAKEVFNASNQNIMAIKTEQDKMTQMLLTVSFTFLVLMAGQCVSHCLWVTKFNFGKPSWNAVEGAHAIIELGIPINSAINWLLYCVTGSVFRKELLVWLRSFVSRPSHNVVCVKAAPRIAQVSDHPARP